MKPILLVTVAAAVAGLCACTTNAPITAWGKEGVSMLDYRTDGGQCAVLAATSSPGENGARSAGGISGQNTPPPSDPNAGRAASDAAVSTNSAPLPTGGSVYRENASPDFVNRAAMQQRTQEISNQRVRSEMLKTCLVERGYTEFKLTSEQRAKLSQLPPGSDERREYLYKLGTDPAVLKKAALPRSGS